MRGRMVAAGLVVLALAWTACASDDGGGAGTDGSPDGGSTGASGATSGGSGGYGRGGYGATGVTGSTGAGAAADMTVTAVNFRFDPATITVASGDVIEVRDTNPQTPHTFTVRGTDVDLAVDPQASGTVTIDLDPGTYDVVCRFHDAQGMTATLTVT